MDRNHLGNIAFLLGLTVSLLFVVWFAGAILLAFLIVNVLPLAHGQWAAFPMVLILVPSIVILLAGLIMSPAGTLMGIVGLFQKQQGKWISLFGLLLNSAMMGLYIAVLIAGASRFHPS